MKKSVAPSAKNVKEKKEASTKKAPPSMAELSERLGFRAQTIVPTGILPLDHMFGGGLPFGIMIDIASNKGYGKSTVVAHIFRTMAILGYHSLYLDIEKGWNPRFIKAMQLNEFIYDKDKNPEGKIKLLRPSWLEEVDEVLDAEFEANPDLRLVGIDSLSMCYPRGMNEGLGKVRMGLKQDYEGQLLIRQKNRNEQRKNQATFFIILHMKNKITSGYGQSYGTFRTDSAAEKCGYIVDVALRMKHKENLEQVVKNETSGVEQKRVIGRIVSMYAEKSRWTMPGVEVEVPIMYGMGVSNSLAVLRLLIDAQVIEVNGSWYKLSPPLIEKEKSFQWGQLLVLCRDAGFMGPLRDYVTKNDLYNKVYPPNDRLVD